MRAWLWSLASVSLWSACASAPPVPFGASTPVIEGDSGGRSAGEVEVVEASAVLPEVPGPLWDPDAPVALPPEVEARVRAVAARRSRRADVFAKVGDSATVNRAFMRCLSEDRAVDLGGREELRSTIEAFRRRVPGGDSFSRESGAAGVSWTVHQVLSGTPSRLAAEVRALSPRFALVMFGGNDVETGSLSRYATRMTELVDHLLAWGVVPVLSTIPPRADDPAADGEVLRYNRVLAAIARGRRVPWIDLHRAMERLPERGLASDGVHPSAPVVDGRAQGCDFSADGLAHGQNVRNLLSLRMLAHLREVIDSEPAAEPEEPTVESEAPRRPPFAVLSTTRGGSSRLDTYEGCDGTKDESGPEMRYPVSIEVPTTLTAEVMYDGDVDVDVHLVSAAGDASACIARGDSALEASVEPGDYEVVVDTFVDRPDRQAHAGDYLLLVEAR